MKICNQCQAINADGAMFCCKCGAQLGVSQHGSQRRNNQSQLSQRPVHQPQQVYQQPQPVYQQQQPVAQQPYQNQQQNIKSPDSHMAMAILTTLFCCLPFGIISIVYASKVSGLYASGDYNGAVNASSKAQSYASWGMILGIVTSLIYVFLFFTGNLY